MNDKRPVLTGLFLLWRRGKCIHAMHLTTANQRGIRSVYLVSVEKVLLHLVSDNAIFVI